jgi:hypothetical protein
MIRFIWELINLCGVQIVLKIKPKNKRNERLVIFMGKSITPKYRLETIELGDSRVHKQVWSGRTTFKLLVEYVQSFEKSTKQGGVNEHLGPRTVIGALIINQKTNNIVRMWKR